MPGLDRSGPQGMGPMTGGARGLCNPAGAGNVSGYGYGRGMAYGRGFRGGVAPGRGMRRGFGAGWGAPPVNAPGYPVTEAEELNMLKQQAADMNDSLEAINRRIKEIETSSE